MRHQLHSVIKASVAFDINVLSIISVSHSKNFISIVIILSGIINFQFNTKISVRITVKYGFRLVAVVVNRTIPVYLIMITFTTVVVAIKMISIVLMKQCITA